MFRDPSGVVPRSLCQAPNIPKLCSWWIGSCPTMPEISSNDSTCPEGDFGPSASSQPTSDSTETLLRVYWDTEAAIGASSIPFPFHMAKVSPTNKGAGPSAICVWPFPLWRRPVSPWVLHVEPPGTSFGPTVGIDCICLGETWRNGPSQI